MSAIPPLPSTVCPTFRLVDEKTGEIITLPARMKCRDGSEITVTAFVYMRHQSGKILTDKNELFVPSVCGAKIVEVAA